MGGTGYAKRHHRWCVLAYPRSIADKDRIAIYGASYGGYATLQGLVVTPTLYAAGVDYVGVSNLFSFMQTIPPIGSQCWT